MAIFNSKLEDRADFLMAAITAAGYGYACYDDQRGGEFYLSPLALGIMGFTAPIAEPPTSFDPLKHIPDGERQSVAEALAQERIRLSMVIQSTGVGEWMRNVETNELVMSERFRQILGLPPNAVINTFAQLEALYHPDDLQALRASRDERVASTAATSVELRMRHHAGHYIWLEATGLSAPALPSPKPNAWRPASCSRIGSSGKNCWKQ